MKLIYIKSTMEPKRLKERKLLQNQTLQEYLDKEKITYEIYLEERKIVNYKRTLTPTHDEPRKKRKLKET